MFQLNLLNCHIQHIIICISALLLIQRAVICTSSQCIKALGMRSKKPQKAGSDSYLWYTKSKICMTIKIQAHSCIYSQLPFYYIYYITHLLHLLHHTSSLTYSQTLHNPEKNYYRKQLHLPLMQNHMNLVFREFIKSFCKQCVIWARVVEGIPHTAVCTWGQIHTV